MWSILSKGRRIFFSPNRNLVNYRLERIIGSSLRFYKNLDSFDDNNVDTTTSTTTTTLPPDTTTTTTEPTGTRILYWNFSNPVSYSGTTTVFDLENNSNGTIMNSPLSGSTGCGTFVDFNGTSQYIYTNTNLGPLFSGVSPNKSEVTSIFMWIYPKGNGVILSEVDIENSLTGWHTSIIEMVSGTLKFGLWSDGLENINVTSSIPTPFNNWYYVGMTYDGSTLNTYINGVSAGNITFNRLTPYNIGTGLFYLLAHEDTTNMGDGGFGDYRIGSLEIYTTSLNSTQINENYTSSSVNYICPTTTTTTLSEPTIESFTTLGTTTWIVPNGVTEVEYLVVAGGGGGGNGWDNAGGGGGGAGMVLSGILSVVPGSSYNITVGDGGIGGVNTRDFSNGENGQNSEFASNIPGSEQIIALGGGLGWGSRNSTTTIGAAQVSDTTAALGGGGGPGGSGGNGGGGASGAGTSRSSTTGGSGGTGVVSTITGSSVTYGVGGAGANSGTQNPGVNGTSNRGNGGRAGGAGSTNSTGGGKGGSGIVVIKYITNTTTTTTTLEPTTTTTTTLEPVPTQLLSNSDFESGTTGWSATGGFAEYSFTSSNRVAILNGVLYFTYISRTVSQSINVSSQILSINSFIGVINIKRIENGPNNNDTYNFVLLFKDSSNNTIITKTTGSVLAPQNFTDIVLTLDRSEIPQTFDTIATVEIQLTGLDAGFWNGNHGPAVNYIRLNVS
jgi:hypothetical protein